MQWTAIIVGTVLNLAYNAIVNGQGEKAHLLVKQCNSPTTKMQQMSLFFPTVIDAEGTIKDGDAVIFCNFRPDRGRELTKALVLPDFDGFKREQLSLYMATMTKYEDGLPVHIVYEKIPWLETLGRSTKHWWLSSTAHCWKQRNMLM